MIGRSGVGAPRGLLRRAAVLREAEAAVTVYRGIVIFSLLNGLGAR